MAYETITDSEIESGKPVTTNLMAKIRGNIAHVLGLTPQAVTGGYNIGPLEIRWGFNKPNSSPTVFDTPFTSACHTVSINGTGSGDNNAGMTDKNRFQFTWEGDIDSVNYIAIGT